MRRVLALAVATLALGLVTAAPASAQVDEQVEQGQGVDALVHSETVRLEGAGPDTVTVSFDRWPVRATQSLDFTFEPEGGIEGRTGLLQATSPSGDPQGLRGIIMERRGDRIVLPRHPEAQQVWGLDVVSLPEEGRWRFDITVESPQGTSTGTLPIQATRPPGPPIELSWTIAMAPWVPVGVLLVYGWHRTKPIRRSVKPSWSG